MRKPLLSPGEAGKRAIELYEKGIRKTIEPEHNGEFLVINLDTGEYVLGKDRLQVSDEAKRAFPDAPRFLIKVGHPAAMRIGWAAAPS